MSKTILAVDDNEDALYALERILTHGGYEVHTVSRGSEVVSTAQATSPDLILLDVMMPEVDGYQITTSLKADPYLRYIPVTLVTAKDSLDDIVHGLDRGADGYITKPFEPEELLARVRAALRMRELYRELKASEDRTTQLAKQLSDDFSFEKIVGESSAMKSVFGLLEKVADTHSPILINGPSGTGKELVARAIHSNSSRYDKPFIAKNCAAFSEQLLESELFGHTKGAFTGALKDKVGLFEAADGGTLFLDEVGEMAPNLQAKLLRVLQEGSFIPVGSTREQKVDVRILSATNRDLTKMIEEGKFREDLFYRLNVITVELPALRERPDDIVLLVEHFLSRATQKQGSTPKVVSDDVIECFRRYPWRGNVRELENEVERMVILGKDQEVLDLDLLSSRIREYQGSDLPQKTGLKFAVEDLEKKMIKDALERLGGNKSQAAKELGISRSNLIQKAKQYNLS